MGLYDRDYTQADFQSRFGRAGQMRMRFPSLTPMVKWLLLINVVVYFVQIMGGDRLLVNWFSVYPGLSLQIWRFVTYQFLHGNLMHIVVNMLGLFFLGPTVERHWGSKKFLGFYIGCGVIGGLCYPILVSVGLLNVVVPLIGASGAILGMLAACAILFPHFVVFFIVFPVPIRVATIICIFIATAIIVSKGANAGGQAAHLGGMAAGAIYVFLQSRRIRFRPKTRSGRWERKMADQQNLQAELDRILQKVHDNGINRLTRKEKKTLREATKAEQMRNK